MTDETDPYDAELALLIPKRLVPLYLHAASAAHDVAQRMMTFYAPPTSGRDLPRCEPCEGRALDALDALSKGKGDAAKLSNTLDVLDRCYEERIKEATPPKK